MSMRSSRLFCLPVAAGVFMMVTLLSGCSGESAPSRAEFDRLPAVITGRGPWGSVALRATPEGTVKGSLPWGQATIQRSGDQYHGSTPWGATRLTYANGTLSGTAPWGKVSVQITEHGVTGKLPWGSVNLVLKGQVLSGTLPWGKVELTIGDRYKSLTEPDVIMALVAILSDKT